MNRLSVLLLALVLCAARGYAQNTHILSGTVRDSATNQPLIKATVLVDYDKVGTGTRTDSEGRFTIGVRSGQRVVVVRHVGYVPFRATLSVRGPVSLDVRLPTVASQLEEVVVTSKGYDRTVREPLLGVSQISMKTLERLPAALGEVDILRSLQLLPGVTSVGEAANGVNIRGGTTDQNLILMDDTPIFNPTHMFGLFSVFRPMRSAGWICTKATSPPGLVVGWLRYWIFRSKIPAWSSLS